MFCFFLFLICPPPPQQLCMWLMNGRCEISLCSSVTSPHSQEEKKKTERLKVVTFTCVFPHEQVDFKAEHWCLFRLHFSHYCVQQLIYQMVYLPDRFFIISENTNSWWQISVLFSGIIFQLTILWISNVSVVSTHKPQNLRHSFTVLMQCYWSLSVLRKPSTPHGSGIVYISHVNACSAVRGCVWSLLSLGFIIWENVWKQKQMFFKKCIDAQ